MKKFDQYVKQHRKRFLKELAELLSFPSISSDHHFQGGVRGAARFIARDLSRNNLRTKIFSDGMNPLVYGENIQDPSLPMVLVYGHYDVQPVEPVRDWKRDPFRPKIINGKIHARGASDDKGQLFIYLKVLEYLNKNGSAPCNIKLIFEGEEEIGSPHLRKFITSHKNLLKADVVLISDTDMFDSYTPSITIGVRGIACFEVAVEGPNQDLHSGVFGGLIENPAIALARILASVTDEEGKILIPGFYDDAVFPGLEERKAYKKLSIAEHNLRRKVGVPNLMRSKSYSLYEQSRVQPTFDVHALNAGYSEKGLSTIIPSKATAKVSFRLVSGQDPRRIAALFKNFILSSAPPTIRIKISSLTSGFANGADTSSKAYKAASKAVQSVYGKKPVPIRYGGSIPAVSIFHEVLGIDSLLLGFGLEEDSAHGPNESFELKRFFSGLQTVYRFFELLARDHATSA